MKPIIGINVDIEGERPKIAKVQAFYYESIACAGGIPVLIPPCSDSDLDEIFSRIDGMLFIGGDDYCPSIYGEEKHTSVSLAHGDRIDFDVRLLQRSLAQQAMPLLGICAGAQILNIGLGGSLYQNIPTDFPESNIQHSSPNGWNEGFHNHKVILRGGTKLAGIYSRKEFEVPTSHHQSIKNLGKGLIATADAVDGVIEAVEMEGRPFVIGVQWHPERDYQGNEELFIAFVKASLAYSKNNSTARKAAV